MKKRATASASRHAPAGPAESKLELSISAAAGKAYAPLLGRRLRQAHSLLKTPVKELSLALVGDRRMSQLHQQFMGIAGPTDVLTFPLDEDRRGRPVSGEIIVCVPEARRQAKARKIPVAHELLLYAIHGLLHLSGFDDTSQRQYHRMHQMEDRIFRQLGIGAVFESPAAKPRTRRGSGADQ